jgi:hypothetical protein
MFALYNFFADDFHFRVQFDIAHFVALPSHPPTSFLSETILDCGGRAQRRHRFRADEAR